CPPQLFVLREQGSRSGDHFWVRADESLSTRRALDDELCSLEDRHVLLHGREGHVVGGRELRDRLLRDEGATEDVPSRRSGQGLEDAVDLDIAELSLCNHLVVRYASRGGPSTLWSDFSHRGARVRIEARPSQKGIDVPGVAPSARDHEGQARRRASPQALPLVALPDADPLPHGPS